MTPPVSHSPTNPSSYQISGLERRKYVHIVIKCHKSVNTVSLKRHSASNFERYLSVLCQEIKEMLFILQTLPSKKGVNAAAVILVVVPNPKAYQRQNKLPVFAARKKAGVVKR